MSKREIRDDIARLKAEVDKLQVDHEADRRRIRDLIGELESTLDETGDLDAEGMLERIDTTVKQLEVEHPTITGILNGIATSLSAYGI